MAGGSKAKSVGEDSSELGMVWGGEGARKGVGDVKGEMEWAVGSIQGE